MTTAVLAASLPSPNGDLALLVHDDVLVAAGFGTPQEQHARLRTPPPLRRVNDLGPFTAALAAYFDGDVAAIDDLPVHQVGGPFRQAAWKLMREVAPGTTITYAELAARAGSPLAARAAGSACAQNLIAPVVPCHRIIRGGGGLGGYAYGLTRKEWLLAHERGERGSRGDRTRAAIGPLR
jgi:methylated-DNA-[protein]-cysteine S-methyltransferase